MLGCILVLLMRCPAVLARCCRIGGQLEHTWPAITARIEHIHDRTSQCDRPAESHPFTLYIRVSKRAWANDFVRQHCEQLLSSRVCCMLFAN